MKNQFVAPYVVEKANIYMFRGQGCGYCKAFLTLNFANVPSKSKISFDIDFKFAIENGYKILPIFVQRDLSVLFNVCHASLIFEDTSILAFSAS